MNLRFDRAEQIRHAYILSALSMEESFARAREIAQAAVCRSGGAVPCGVCSACRKAQNGAHPDISVVERLLDDKGKQKREIQVDQVREMAADAAVLPNEAERKVYIIRDADRMNTEAQNAALKLLEEPPKGVIFLLCVTNPGKLLVTVRSRCVLMNFSDGEESGDATLGALAEEYLQLAAAGDTMKLLRFCEGHSALTFTEMADFCSITAGKITDMLCGRSDRMKMTVPALLALEQLMEQCIQMLKVNVSVKQIFGLLEIKTLPEIKTKRKRNLD